MDIKENLPQHPSVRTRLAFLIAGVAVVLLLSFRITGSIAPKDNMQALIFQGGFLLVVFGSLFLEDKFTKPADAVISAIATIISLIPVYTSPKDTAWFLVMIYSLIVLVVDIVNLAIVGGEEKGGARARLIQATYQVSTTLGKSNVIFSIVFLYAVFSFYGLRSEQAAILVIFWGVYIALWPLKIPHVLQALFSTKNAPLEQGIIVRVDDPDLVKVRLHQTVLESGQCQRRRCCRMSMSEMLTIAVHFHQKRFRDFKIYYTEYVAIHLRTEFPQLLSYSRFIHSCRAFWWR